MSSDSQTEKRAIAPAWYPVVADWVVQGCYAIIGAGAFATVMVLATAFPLSAEAWNLFGGILGAGLGAAGGVIGSMIMFRSQEAYRRRQRIELVQAELMLMLAAIDSFVEDLKAPEPDEAVIIEMRDILIAIIETAQVTARDEGLLRPKSLSELRLVLTGLKRLFAAPEFAAPDAAAAIIGTRTAQIGYLSNTRERLWRLVKEVVGLKE